MNAAAPLSRRRSRVQNQDPCIPCNPWLKCPLNSVATKIPKPPKSAAETRAIMKKLERQHPGADTELHFTTPVRVAGRDDPLGAVHRRARQPGHAGAVQALSRTRRRCARRRPRSSSRRSSPPVSSARSRSRSPAWRPRSCEQHGGEIPRTMEELTELPGVGRKTANVVLGHALGVPGLPVDRHVLRVSNRIGIATRRRSRGRRAAALRGDAAGEVDEDVRHADPPRPPHLQAEAAAATSAPCARIATTTGR